MFAVLTPMLGCLACAAKLRPFEVKPIIPPAWPDMSPIKPSNMLRKHFRFEKCVYKTHVCQAFTKNGLRVRERGGSSRRGKGRGATKTNTVGKHGYCYCRVVASQKDKNSEDMGLKTVEQKQCSGYGLRKSQKTMFSIRVQTKNNW